MTTFNNFMVKPRCPHQQTSSQLTLTHTHKPDLRLDITVGEVPLGLSVMAQELVPTDLVVGSEVVRGTLTHDRRVVVRSTDCTKEAE